MKTIRRVALLCLIAATASADTFTVNRPSTTDNDDSCDISVMPAATLLLPYFRVSLVAPISVAETTIFTVINTSNLPQIARTTIWTDMGYPVLTFSLFLTGYDVQAINLYDILARGVIAPERGTSNANTPGSRSLSNFSNPRFFTDVSTKCSRSSQPVQIPVNILTGFQSALTTGILTNPCGNTRVGTTHEEASGYVTIDVVGTCSFYDPQDPRSFNELLYDNVLAGDYQHIQPNPATGNYAGGNPLVHIRAIPEGGPAGVAGDTFLPYTFYDRFTPRSTPRMDRRQPLPATFAARWIEGGAQAFQTDLQIWREGITGPSAACSSYASNSRPFTDVVRFDERENPTAFAPPPLSPAPTLPLTSRTRLGDAFWRPILPSTGDVAGWVYLNLHNGQPRTSQNWVSTQLFAEGRFSTAMDATMLANGCTGSGGDN